jgi:protein-tyrosine phosphatase
VIDLHCHILPGIDDGPADVDGTLDMARAQVAAGVTRVTATPHVTFDIPNDAPGIARSVAEVGATLRAHEIGLEVLTGAEIGLTRAADLDDEALAALALGGGPWLLVEAPLRPLAGVAPVVQGLQMRGHRVLLGHPERSPVFQRDPEALVRLVAGGVLCQVTAGSFAGRFGATVQRFTERLAAEGLIHNVASDAHDAVRRAPGMRAELDAAGLSSWAPWWTEEVPAAIVAGDALPRRPGLDPAPTPAGRGRGSWFRRASRRR